MIPFLRFQTKSNSSTPCASYEARKKPTSKTFPDPSFFLFHVVNINYPGKIIAFLGTVFFFFSKPQYVEVYSPTFWLLLLYACSMYLGTYWYTRFWAIPSDIHRFYQSSPSEHALRSWASANFICTMATLFYFIFFILFLIAFIHHKQEPFFGTMAVWNALIVSNLLFAIPFLNTW